MIQHLVKLIDDIEEGNINPLGIYKETKFKVDQVIILFDRIKELSIIEAESWSKLELQQHNFELRNGKTNYVFDSNEEYNELNSKLKELKNKIKNDVPSKRSRQSLIIRN